MEEFELLGTLKDFVVPEILAWNFDLRFQLLKFWKFWLEFRLQILAKQNQAWNFGLKNSRKEFQAKSLDWNAISARRWIDP